MKHTHTAATLIETIKSKYSSEYESLCLVPKNVKPTKINIDQLETSLSELEALAQRNVPLRDSPSLDEPQKLDDIKSYSDSNSTTSAATTLSNKDDDDDDDEDDAEGVEKMVTSPNIDHKKVVNVIEAMENEPTAATATVVVVDDLQPDQFWRPW